MMKRWMIVVLGLCVIGCLSCDEKSDDENPFTEVGDISLFDAEGNVSTGLDAGASAFWQFDQLLPRTLYNIELKNETGNMVSQASLTTDANGEIPLTAIGYDLGLLFPGGITNGSLAKIGRATVETFTLEIYNTDGILVSSFPFPVDYGAPTVYAADQNGDAQNSFLLNAHSVYAKGVNIPAGTYAIYVVDNVTIWEDGMSFVDVSGGPENVTVNASGEFHTMVWSSPSLVAPYDIVLDADNSGTYTAGDLVDGYYPVGFIVQVLGTGAHIQVQIACDASRDYKDIFEVSENVYAYLNPRTQQFTHKWVHKYVVVHKDVWNDGDPLNDVTQGPELDTPQYGCTNEGRVLIWPSNLTPGEYDIVIDVDRNGLYDIGLDFLDNIDSFGLPTAGFVVPGQGNGPTVTITYPTDGMETDQEVVYLAGTVADSSISNARLYVNGSEQTIAVYDSLIESTAIILQRDWNTIRVEAFNEYGLGFDEVSVKGNFPYYGMKITLTWDVGPTNDVDLWVQDPTGEWCGWTNKTTTIGGWLDVDDMDGWGPENFRLSQDAVNANPGVYNVYVKYYSDSGEGPTTPTINVLLNEGQTNQIQRTMVGPKLMESGAIWNVTSITMPGGTFSDYVPTGLTKKVDLPPKKK